MDWFPSENPSGPSRGDQARETRLTGELTNVAQKTSKSNGRTFTKSPKKATSRRAKATTPGSELETTVPEREVSLDRRRTNRRLESAVASPPPASDATPLERRQKVNRRRQIDPTTCERDYTEQEVEFMNAMDEYKRKSGRMFPTCSEVLEVLRGLGYVKLPMGEMGTLAVEQTSTPSAKPMPSDWSADANTEPAAFGSDA
jgi:hypothetical protein